MKIASILGARPQFIKSWAVSDALRQAGATEVILHTGQHYDSNMSAQFFRELGLAEPQYNLGIGSAPHGAQTGRMLEAIERVLADEHPRWVVVYGDTNSTLAGALAAAKLQLPIAHVEAGLRSFNRSMPEEINRVLTDHVSERLFCPSRSAVDNLTKEGITRGVEIVGDVMQDSLRHFVARARAQSRILEHLGLQPGKYHVATVHRADVTEDPERLRMLLSVLGDLDRTVLLPLHPRTRARVKTIGIDPEKLGTLKVIEPLGYLDMIQLVASCDRVLTDSGGLQKEAYWLGRPCVTLRSETEWVETVAAGWNTLAGTDAARIRDALMAPASMEHPELYGDGHAAARIAAALVGRD